MPADRVGRLPLSALLSQVLVAFTIECDNQFELQMPHRTSNYGSTAGLFSAPGDGPRPTPEPRPDSGATPGRYAQDKYREQLGAVEDGWQAWFGGETLGAARDALEQLTGDHARLAAGLGPAAGARRCAGQPRRRTTRWCCTAAGSPTAAR